jgi:hypothetical protein
MIDDSFDNTDDLELPELPPLPDESADDPASPFSVAVATVAGMTGVRALRNAWHRRRDETPADAPIRAERPPESDPDPAPPAEPRIARLEEERATLVDLCIELDDMVTSAALREKLRRGLRRVGVETVQPEGERFDPEIHRAVGSDAAPDAEHELTVARVERAGFRDGGVELRPPEVIVFSAEAPARDD